ncbi:GNAT family N-acetyltransferase [Rhizobium lusitanum]|uniref:GNAT superfamily N-acetyltransferase n=1 Tax=Rhizobium lusitanum TaxID=293958 RepID=A0A7X0IMA3_9HYPH|nr:GNAT family N-acetyltransferase [Rhizobium lusitanum]MBB6483611.1 GNAT superfamily N-acetyltransferase [Rhizobium lusitanum]
MSDTSRLNHQRDLFSATVTAFWRKHFQTGTILHRDDQFSLAVSPDLDDDNRAMVLHRPEAAVQAAVTTAVADRLGLHEKADLSEAEFRRELENAEIILNGADAVFYYLEPAKQSLLQETSPNQVRQLTELDRAIFEEFQAAASDEDLDAAYVELDHWLVFGAFEGPHLVCAASMYPWNDAPIADVGVLTLTAFRGKGHARNVMRAISRQAYAQGYEPQYRCQLDNHASMALATAIGLTEFGKWEVVATDSPN